MDFWIGLGFGILGIIITIAIFLYQERAPKLNVICRLKEDNDPSIIECEIINSGRAEASGLSIGFRRWMPYGATIVAAPEYGLELTKSLVSRDIADMFPTYAENILAFAVKVPLVPKKSSVKFSLVAADEDNLRAAKQLTKIKEIASDRLSKFTTRLLDKYLLGMPTFRIDMLINGEAKRAALFSPSDFLCEQGKLPIQFISEEEDLALRIHQDIYSQFKKDNMDIFDGSIQLQAPVIKVSTSQGYSTVAIMGAYVSTYVLSSFVVSDVAKGEPVKIPFEIPEKYN